MTSTAKLFELTQLAEASYALLEGTENNDFLLQSRLISQDGEKYNFSPSQATRFVEH